ncbi:MAG: isoprenoid biosynthesis glyoxalase ElbB [Bacteroidales bacterium]|jgi:enhancing lycopene biosynthesis protein 2|nr:isoprenoid biosynthesis glyoxalase ElbB [Bacteroidales bacterium]
MKKFAIVIAGSGVFDGAEIHEAVMTMLAVKKAGADYQMFAPDAMQHHVINHLTGEEMPEKRNVLVESARIARGNIKPLAEYDAKQYDALIFPGGFGVAKNLCTFAFDGPDCKVNSDVEKAVLTTHALKKPIGALCIAPALISRLLGDVEVTIGDDAETAESIAKMGSKHIKTTHGEVVFDKKNNVFTTPCYMLDASIADIELGARNIVNAMLEVM